MKTLSVTEVSRNFSLVLDEVERDQQEVVLVRNKRSIARLIPEPQGQNALEMLGDLYRKLDDETAESLSKAIAKGRSSGAGTLDELKDPWAS